MSTIHPPETATLTPKQNLAGLNGKEMVLRKCSG